MRCAKDFVERSHTFRCSIVRAKVEEFLLLPQGGCKVASLLSLQEVNHDDTTNTTGFYAVFVVSLWFIALIFCQNRGLCNPPGFCLC